MLMVETTIIHSIKAISGKNIANLLIMSFDLVIKHVIAIDRIATSVVDTVNLPMISIRFSKARKRMNVVRADGGETIVRAKKRGIEMTNRGLTIVVDEENMCNRARIIISVANVI
ncbi:MAG: hypothetical protein DRH49_04935 [Candidatus Coatesbacteria bacterium]|nr:MAG: hypothetical protein DRH49_04935 [Candidatus Coatesbacteria bacterium]